MNDTTSHDGRLALWREAAQQGITEGVDWPGIAQSLFRDLDNALAFKNAVLADRARDGRDSLAARLAEAEGALAHPVVLEIAAERERQTAKHGNQTHLPDGTGTYALPDLEAGGRHRYAVGIARWAKARTDAASHSQGDGTVTFEHILTEEWAEAICEDDPAALRAELVQVAAVAVQWIEALDLRGALVSPAEPNGDHR